MTLYRLIIASVLAAGALAVSGIASAGAPDTAPERPTALVIDASLARDGRDLIDDRLESTSAELRLPRTAREARTNVRYFESLGYHVNAAGPVSEAALAAVRR